MEQQEATGESLLLLVVDFYLVGTWGKGNLGNGQRKKKGSACLSLFNLKSAQENTEI